MQRTFIASFALGLLLSPGGGVMAEPAAQAIPLEARDVRPLRVGDSVPNGALQSIDGKPVAFKDLITHKPSVVIFYRGGWCPFCNIQMGQLATLEPSLTAMGYQILAVSPDQPAKLKESLDKHHLAYTLLSDRTMDLTRQFGLAYRVSHEVVAKMKQYGSDLESSTGNTLHLLPVPAAYVVDRKGVIHFVYFNPDIKVRVNPDELLKAAKAARVT